MAQNFKMDGHELPLCFDEMFNRLGNKEIFLLVNRPKIFLAMINCDSSTYYIEVAVHEAVHMMDFNITMDEALKLDEEKLKEITKYQFRSEGDVLLLSNLGLPKPSVIVHKLIQESFPSLLEDPNSNFVSFYNDYILDEDTASSFSFEFGFSTELNAYAHGTVIEDHLKRKNRENPQHGFFDKIIGQRQGGIFFLSLHHAYLSELKKKAPEKFKKLLEDKVQKRSIHSNLERMIDAIIMSHKSYPLGKGEFSDGEVNIVNGFKKLRDDEVIGSFIEKEKLDRLNKIIDDI